MKTVWGEHLDENNILAEYPRPQLVRESYLNLNGLWEYAFTQETEFPQSYEGSILVPFSPECELSGVMRQLKPSEYLWYRKKVVLKNSFIKDSAKLLLHFGAVDQSAVVYVNKKEVCAHEGGYLPFCADILPFIKESALSGGDISFELTVRVRDLSDTSYYSRGKQALKPGGIWYTAQSGIWQSVWCEAVCDNYIQKLKITPLFDEKCVRIRIITESDEQARISLDGKLTETSTNTDTVIDLNDVKNWTFETPYLYSFTAETANDAVKSYFGMRKFSVDKDDEGVPRLFLNNEPYFHNGLLDQGYYSDGLYTAPSDEAMIYDIQTAKDMGFNMLRKHIKIEPLRWYYHCDRLGMLVWQDMVNGGGKYDPLIISTPLVTNIHLKDDKYRLFARESEAGRLMYFKELEETVELLYNVPSLAMWVTFNEGWGQFDAKNALEHVLALDTTRTIDHASGWHDQYIGELKSLHVYFKKYVHKADKQDRAVVLSEFGGYNLKTEGHSFSDKNFGYSASKTSEGFFEKFRRLYNEQIKPAVQKGLAASVYTQLTDVEDELNGLITYDRRQLKVPAEQINSLMKDININTRKRR